MRGGKTLPQATIMTHSDLGPYFLKAMVRGTPAVRMPRLKIHTQMLKRWPMRLSSFSMPWILALPIWVGG